MSRRGTVQQAQTMAVAQCNRHRQWQRHSVTSTNRDRGTVQQATQTVADAQCNKHRQWQTHSATSKDSGRCTVQQAQTVADAQCNKHRQWQRHSATSTDSGRRTVQQAQTVAEAQCNKHRQWKRHSATSTVACSVLPSKACSISDRATYASPIAATFPQYLPVRSPSLFSNPLDTFVKCIPCRQTE